MYSTAFLSRGHSHWTKIGSAALVLLVLTSAHAGQASASCRLLQPAELESALGGTAARFSGSTVGNADMCSVQIGKLKVLIRVGMRQRDDGGATERKGIEMLRKMGVQVEVETEGDLTCSTAIPPASLSQYGFNTTCSIVRAERVVAVEVTAPSREEMASMDAVRKLVKKAVTRL